ncbi:carbohydrate ABC transporter membrane protein 2, CUT1 family [Pyrodictium delaneyi]|uniref:Carbohydrate ABC transporter membrane protein 2, CUT1 family n=1 Tax=Pyrodictium delaneyi TaxID=1273541 RepID=A0A0P0N5Q6_9CREN|nr:carbohydrate ABC transporter permease [Pyrodictium delaneyi]ALL01830.1 carbohydrate ABC transporter membrane protein 2, CUT1 family [Pyrodictium delaneyi]OWJ54956.1 sugar transporter [Pyrodictium delaneyi]
MVLSLLGLRRRKRDGDEEYLAVQDVETLPRRRLTLVLGLAVGLATVPLVMLYVLLVLSSFADQMLSGPDIFTARYSLENWRLLFEGRLEPAAGRLYTTRDLAMIVANTLLVAAGVTVVVIVTSVMAGYAFSRMRFWGRRRLMEFIILLHAFPGVALIIAVYAIYVWSLGLVPREAITGYRFLYTILARAALEIPMSIWLMKGFFDRIPWEVEWSAMIDGASRLRVWWQIVLPQVKPGIAALAIFAFLAGWEDLIYVHVFLYTGGIKTLATFIEEVVGNIETAYLPIAAAAGTLYLLPTIIFFVATQRLLLQAMSGGVKG